MARFREPRNGTSYTTFRRNIRLPHVPWRSYAPNVVAMHDLIVGRCYGTGDRLVIGRVLGRAIDRWVTVGDKTTLAPYADDDIVLAVLSTFVSAEDDPLALGSLQVAHVPIELISRVAEHDNLALLWLFAGKMPSIGEAFRAVNYGALGPAYIAKYLEPVPRSMAETKLKFDEVRREIAQAGAAADREAARARKARTKDASKSKRAPKTGGDR